MGSISNTFDEFATAYQRTLYAIEQEEVKAQKDRQEKRDSIKKKYERRRSVASTSYSNDLMAALHKVTDVSEKLKQRDGTIMDVAEYLNYGSVQADSIKKVIYSDTSIPCIVPLIGHGNVMLTSNGDECYALGVQFVLKAILQTASGQLSVTVINPELRPEFSVFSKLTDFRMLTAQDEIIEFLNSIAGSFMEIDELLQGSYRSLVELRKVAGQPVGKLRLIVIQDILSESQNDNMLNQLVRIMKSAPRAGIAVLVLSSKKSQSYSRIKTAVGGVSNFTVFNWTSNHWSIGDARLKDFTYTFPAEPGSALPGVIAQINEEAKASAVITIPFGQIERDKEMWCENATESITFNLGKSGLDIVSVCIGDEVNQRHNILISGAVGKGKSNLLEVMIHSLCRRYSPDELELYLLDFKDGLTFKPYSEKGSWLPHARMLGLESDRDVGLAVMKDLEEERQHRADVFRSAGTPDYIRYRRKYPHEVMPRIVLMIDEYHKLFETNDAISEESSALLENLTRQGRACGIHIVLASQSINGAAGLLGKEERIYAQFPVRIALQNTVSESYALFGIGNDAAATLRIRGEAIINENYGHIDSNKKLTVAYAEPEEIKKLRQSFCARVKNYPVIFTRQDLVNYSMFIPVVKKWRRAVGDTGVIHIPMGIKLSVKRNVISLPLMNDMGKNIAILGSAENLHKDDVFPGEHNMALGMIQGICYSLALQHPDGNARFVLLNGVAKEVYKNSNMTGWCRLMERFGFPVEVIEANDVNEWLSGFKQEINSGISDEDTYVICIGMDRYINFTQMNMMGETGVNTFQQMLKYGAQGVHFICWWSNVGAYKNHMGFGNDGYFGTKILLRMDSDTSRDVLGPFISWSVRENRAYIHDNSELPEDEVVIPMMPMDTRLCGSMEAEGWLYE